MNNRVLVTYATKYGSTAEIAVKIGHVLRENRLDTDVIPVENVDDVYMYRAVVLGSAVYMGQWRKEAVQFLQRFKVALMDKPVWIFSSGPTGEGDPDELMHGWIIPKNVEDVVDEIQVRDIAVFHGDLNTNKLNMLEKWIIRNVKAQVGDFRDWDMITAWAKKVACEIKDPEFA